MPQILSPSFDPAPSATLIKWHIPDGATVQIDEPLCELETDHATVEIEAFRAGTLKHLKAEGDSVKPGDRVAEIS